jgi:hypothetical protein
LPEQRKVPGRAVRGAFSAIGVTGRLLTLVNWPANASKATAAQAFSWHIAGREYQEMSGARW